MAPATVAGVALGFGAQQVVGDLLAGFFLFAEHQFGYGDDIRFSQPGQTKGVMGTVEEMTLRVTKLRTIEGELVIIPNSLLGQVTNLSKDWSQAVLDLPIAVGEDLELTNSVLRDASMTLVTDDHWAPLLLREPVVAGVQRVEVGYYLVRVLVRTLPGRQFEVLRELRLRCATALTAAGIASPHIDLWAQRMSLITSGWLSKPAGSSSLATIDHRPAARLLRPPRSTWRSARTRGINDRSSSSLRRSSPTRPSQPSRPSRASTTGVRTERAVGVPTVLVSNRYTNPADGWERRCSSVQFSVAVVT